MSSLARLCAAVGVCYAVGIFGSLFIGTSLSTWYSNLLQPPLAPPQWLFFPAWLILYTLMGIAYWLILKKESWHSGWSRCFGVSLLFNGAWPIFFFGYHTTLIAFMDIICLDFIVAALIIGAIERDRRAALLLAPYLLWILYASYLSAGLWWLNF